MGPFDPKLIPSLRRGPALDCGLRKVQLDMVNASVEAERRKHLVKLQAEAIAKELAEIQARPAAEVPPSDQQWDSGIETIRLKLDGKKRESRLFRLICNHKKGCEWNIPFECAIDYMYTEYEDMPKDPVDSLKQAVRGVSQGVDEVRALEPGCRLAKTLRLRFSNSKAFKGIVVWLVDCNKD